MPLTSPTPTPSTLLTTLLTNINTSLPPTSDQGAPNPTQNPLSPTSLPQTAKPLLLTLHVLYPTQFLPALDILDRHLLTRLTYQFSQTTPISQTHRDFVYLVRSASIPSRSETSSRFHDVLGSQVYEVRVRSWNCTCPAFAFAAFPPINGSGDEDGGGEEDGWDGGDSRDGEGVLGGLMTGKGREVLPMCKHLLACVLVERIEALGGYVEEREGSLEEVAGWAAGWGG